MFVYVEGSFALNGKVIAGLRESRLNTASNSEVGVGDRSDVATRSGVGWVGRITPVLSAG